MDASTGRRSAAPGVKIDRTTGEPIVEEPEKEAVAESEALAEREGAPSEVASEPIPHGATSPVNMSAPMDGSFPIDPNTGRRSVPAGVKIDRTTGEPIVEDEALPEPEARSISVGLVIEKEVPDALVELVAPWSAIEEELT